MSDDDVTPAEVTPHNEALVEPAVVETPVVDDEAARTIAVEPEEHPAVPETAEVAPVREPLAQTGEVAPANRVVYLVSPTAPVNKGNRGIGALFAVLSTIVYIALLAVITVLIGVSSGDAVTFDFMGRASFYIPALFFVVGFVLLTLLLNRASWWVYILASLILGIFVYFGTIGLGLLTSGIINNTPTEAAVRFAAVLRDPFVIFAALLAREVSLWTGAIIAARGRRVKARNVESRSAYERELAEKKAEHERPTAAATAQ
jgi:hypothetical protein